MTGIPRARPRPRELGVTIGRGAPGPTNTIVDVPGVRVGHVTLWSDTPSAVRTGVTAIVPDALDRLYAEPCAAGVAVLNGAGELTGAIEIAEWGLLETPVLLTNTMSVGRAFDGCVDALLELVPACGRDDVSIPVVGECDDSWLNDVRARAVTAAAARDAIVDASTSAQISGAVGAGTGMVCFGYKGGIGTASRRVGHWTVGVLALTNFGAPGELRVDGVLVGEPAPRAAPEGSCIVVVATDAPIDAHTCERVARRAGLGLARTGSVAHHGSGEIFLAFSTTARSPRRATAASAGPERATDQRLNDLFTATVEATEESVIDSLFTAATVTGLDGHTAPAFPTGASESAKYSHFPTHQRV